MSLRILAVDLSGIFSMSWMAAQGQELSEGFRRTVDAVARHREGFDRVAVCVDSGVSFRRSLWPSYKMNRTDRGAAYYAQLRRTAERLGKDGCAVFWAPPYSGIDDPEGADYRAEADDVLASLCAWAKEGSHVVRVLSADKDLLQLVSDGAVDLVKPDGKILTEPDVLATFQVPARKIPLLLGLAGDRSDNFKPYEGLGEKRAVELIRAYAQEDFQGVDAIWAHVEDFGPLITDAVAKRLKEAGPEPGRKALQVATLVSNLEMDFSKLLADPVRQPIAQPEAELTAIAPRAEPAPPAPAPEAAATQKPRRQTALVKAPEPEAVTLNPYALQPRSLAELSDLAVCLFNSRMYGHGSMEAIMAAAVEANERGQPIGKALRNSYDVRGRLAWSASWLAGLVLSSPVCEYADVVESDDTHCVIEYKKKGRPAREYAFTIEDAKKAGWVKSNIGKDGRESCKWITNPRSMCTWACWRQMARERFPEVVSGLYTPDELRDGEMTDAEFISMEAAS